MFIEKKKWVAGLLLALAVVCLASGCSLQKEAASDELWGRADAKEIDINSKVAGRVVQLRVKEGDTVKQGDIIAYIDQRDLLAQKAQAEANIKALQAQVRQSGVVTDLQDSNWNYFKNKKSRLKRDFLLENNFVFNFWIYV